MTLNELRAVLDKLVADRPECGEMPAVYDHGYVITGIDVSRENVNLSHLSDGLTWLERNE